jgi:Fic family protein
MTTYNWQQPDWPQFEYDLSAVHATLHSITEKMGYLNGQISHLTQPQQTETMINLMVEEAVKSFKIEGEMLRRADVRSSIKNQLGLHQEPILVRDSRAEGVARLILDVRNTFLQPLTEDKLFDWHLALLSSSRNPHLQLARWRSHHEPMQIISGSYARQIIHFEAPPSHRVPKEMQHFLEWFNHTAPGTTNAILQPPVRAAIAHLYFESIHPFEDGNGRIGRAIAEKALSQGFGYPVMLSLSQAIEADKKSYYTALHAASKTNVLTNWIIYFSTTILSAQRQMENQLNFVLKKISFFNTFEKLLNERQMKVVRRMFKSGMKGFEGGMSTKKYIVIAETSKATATRDLQHLHEVNAFRQLGAGRNVRYEINLEN